MDRLSNHFTREEFACKDNCGFDTVDVALLDVLELVRETYGSVHINSGSRCKAHNKAVGGSDGSMHRVGKAADIVIKDVSATVIYNFLDREFPDTFGLGLYKSPPRVHVDVRSKKARWTG